MVELNNLRTLLKRSVLYMNTNKSNHLRLLKKIALTGDSTYFVLHTRIKLNLQYTSIETVHLGLLGFSVFMPWRIYAYTNSSTNPLQKRTNARFLHLSLRSGVLNA